MMHWMRKHRKWILWGIVIIVVPSFIAWGGYRGRGRGGEGQGVSQIVATVGNIPITREQYMDRLNDEVRRRARYNPEASLENLVADGTAEKILDSMIDAALIDIEAAKIQPTLSRDYLIERLKQESAFQDENGNFNPTLWNDWVTSGRQNWNQIYASIAAQVAREIVIKEAMAPARVLDDEVRDEFEKNFTKYQVKYVELAPEVTPTDEQLQKQYDKDPSKYQTPEQRYVEYVGVSLKPQRPAELDEILKKARAGEDFAELAKQYSHNPRAKENGGEVGWFTESQTLPDYLKSAVALNAGEVSEPVESNGIYYIFKVDEVKPDEETGEPSKHVRQIILRPSLSEEERQALDAKASDFALKALETGDFTGLAADMGLEVKTAKEVSAKTTEIEGMPREDVRSFVEKVKTIPADGLSGVIDSVRNLYVARVLEVEPAAIRPLEDVRDLVKEDVIKEVKQTPEYRQRMREAAERVEKEAKTLDQAVEMFPDLKLEVKETQPFSQGDFLFNQGILLQTKSVIDAVADAAPGEMAGPVFGFGAQSYVFQLVDKTPPTEEDWTETFPKEEKKLRDKMLAQRQNMLLMDYVAALRERAATEVPIRQDANAISDALGLNKAPVAAEGEGEGEGEGETAGSAAAVPEAAAAAAPAAAPEAAPEQPAQADAAPQQDTAAAGDEQAAGTAVDQPVEQAAPEK